MKYRLIAIDLDGTLLCPEGKVSEENRAALHAAHERGVVVLPCTGRAWRESCRVLDSVPDAELGVFNTGGMVHELRSGSTVHRTAFDAETANGLIELLRPMPEAVLVFTDPAETGLEYVITGDGQPTNNSLWWFEHNGLRFARHAEPPCELMDHVVRVSAVVARSRAIQIERDVAAHFGDTVEVHSFGAVQRSDEGEELFITEVFPKGVTKWLGIRYVAERFGIGLDEVAVIGDQINDLPMFAEAACAVAMGNAIEPIKQVAHRHTHRNDEHGVAHAIRQMLNGVW
ncbi:MAG: HAD hydrolase family protein [Planctomycetota bacterium]